MKNLLIITTFVFTIVFSSTSFGEWTRVGSNEDGSIFYMDFERLRKHDGYVYFWTLQDYLKPTDTGNLSAKVYYRGDCKNFRKRMLSLSLHKEPMGRGSVKVINTKNDYWVYAIPDSIDETYLESVCSR